jgi:Phosphoinositide phospholipase C, Ca2+-dependent
MILSTTRLSTQPKFMSHGRSRSSRSFLAAVLITWTAAIPLSAFRLAVAGDDVRWNQIQVIGTHNSYHLAPVPAVSSLIAAAGQEQAEALDYSHPPLADQFSVQGVRQIELDLFSDPNGGHYADPAARKSLRAMGRDPGPDPDATGALRRPGIKILHVPDVDYRTTVPTLVDALTQVRNWSRAHASHVPIMILLELKADPVASLPTKPLPFDREALKSLESEILSVFSRRDIIVPEEVRGSYATLAEAVRRAGWPKLAEVRGRVMFAIDNEDHIRDRYLDLHPQLQGQLCFVSVPETHPQAAWFKINDPIGEFERIRRLVDGGFLVRTRADADTRQARSNETTQRDKALASGAQFVSTDYPQPDRRFSPYCVQFPIQTVARANPVSAHGRWTGLDLEPGKQEKGRQ